MERTLGEVVNTGAVINSASNNGPAAERDSMSDNGLSESSGGGPLSPEQQAALLGAPQFEAMKISSLLRLPAVVTFGDSATCFALNERIVAAESCWFVAMVRNCDIERV